MENAALIGLSSQMALRHRMDVIANNIANLNTFGFKRESVLFEEYLMPAASMEMAGGLDTRLSYVRDLATVQDHAQGPVKQTGNPLDVAINGRGFFVVGTPEGDRYTRNGAFALNHEGQLVTGEGQPVLGTAGPITFDSSETDIRIAVDGTVSSSAGQKGMLRLVSFADERALSPVGTSLFAAADDAGARPALQARLQQGAIEGSNVQPVVEITRMIEVQRTYQTLTQMMARSDEMRRDAIGKLADMPA